MIVSPEAMSASSAPSARPLKSWETKLGQVITGAGVLRSCVVAELAAERIRLLHERAALHDLGHLPEVLLVPHLLGCLAAHDDHRADELVVLLAEVDLAHHGVELAPGLVRLDDVRRVEGAG